MFSHVFTDPRRYQGPMDDGTRAIPPEVFLRRQRSLRFERNGVIYASDGRVGTLKQIVVAADVGEVTEVVVSVEVTGQTVILPVALVEKTGGSAVFLTLSRAQFAERAGSAPAYEKRRFTKARLRPLRKNGKRAETQHRSHAVAHVGPGFVETPVTPRPDLTERQR